VNAALNGVPSGRHDRPGPDFIGIGPGKAGTTWVYEQLRAHPQVFMPDEKELHYFDEELYGPPGSVNLRSEQPLDWYHDQFIGADPDQVRGEITPSYFTSRAAPPRVRAAYPDVNLFSIVRRPQDRLWSMYLFATQKGEIARVDFAEALERYPYLLERCHNSPAIERWFEHFGAPELRVWLYDDLRDEPTRFLAELHAHIGVDARTPSDPGRRANETGQHRYPRLNRSVMRARVALRRSRTLERTVQGAKRIGLGAPFSWLQRQVRPFDDAPRLEPAQRARLDEVFAADIDRLAALLGRDLDHWKWSNPTHVISNSSAPFQDETS